MTPSSSSAQSPNGDQILGTFLGVVRRLVGWGWGCFMVNSYALIVKTQEIIGEWGSEMGYFMVKKK